MKVESICIVFENCESLTYDAKDIRYFNVYGIKTNFNNYGNGSFKSQSIDGLYMIIKNNAVPIEECLFSNRNPNDRILTDITQISIAYEDSEEVDHFYLNWEGDNECYAENQTINRTERFIEIIHRPYDKSLNFATYADDDINIDEFL